jgi:hypothetical protein
VWKVLWVVRPGFVGQVLVRGVASDGKPLSFSRDASVRPSHELRIEWRASPDDAYRESDAWREFGSYTWIPGPGCYQWQVDFDAGTTLTVFEARLEP